MVITSRDFAMLAHGRTRASGGLARHSFLAETFEGDRRAHVKTFAYQVHAVMGAHRDAQAARAHFDDTRRRR
ncbi:MAG: hypothetical protein IPM80_03735 [Proteobacteria bacterium]|nr:hypothetical protein [Pseudomonadota bacterium]